MNVRAMMRSCGATGLLCGVLISNGLGLVAVAIAGLVGFYWGRRDGLELK